MVSKGSKETYIIIGSLAAGLILGLILAAPLLTKETSKTEFVNETISTPQNISNVTSNIVEKKTQSVTTSEVSSLLSQIVNNLPTILGILLPLIVILLFRKEIQKILNKNNLTSVEVSGFKIGLAGYPEVSEVGQRDGLLWRGRVTEMITTSLFGTANISEGEIKKLEARIEKNLGALSEIVIKGIGDQQKKSAGEYSSAWNEYSKLHYEIGKDRLRLADIYNTINKKEEATHQVAEAGSNLRTLTGILLKVNPFMDEKADPSMEGKVKTFKEVLQDPGSKIVNKDEFNEFVENFADLLLASDAIRYEGVCKHLEAYISKSYFPNLLFDAIERYKGAISLITKFFREKEPIDLIKKIEQVEEKIGHIKIKDIEDDKQKLQDDISQLKINIVIYYIYVGDAYLRLRDYEEAEKYLDNLEKILDNKDKFKKIKTEFNKLLNDKDKIKKTELQRFELLLTLHITKGEMFYQQAYTDKANQEFENAIRIIKEIKEAAKSEEKEIKYKYDYRYDISAYWWQIKNIYENAKRLQASGLNKEAMEVFEKAIEIFEANRGQIKSAFGEGSTFSFTGIAQIYYDLALLCVNAHELESAEENLKKAIKILPEDPELHIALGNVRFSNKEYEKAIEEYDHALRQDPSHPIALLNKAAVEQRLHKKGGGEDGEAKKEPEKVGDEDGKNKK